MDFNKSIKKIIDIAKECDIVDITIGKKDYLIFKNAARAEEKEAKKEESIGENDDGNA